VHPQARRRFGVESRAFYFEVELDAVGGRAARAQIVAPPRFPAATRDVSFLSRRRCRADGSVR